MTEHLPLRERQIEVRKNLNVEFTYPPQHSSRSSSVPVLVDFKKFMELTSIKLGKMPSPLKRWIRKIAPRDEYEAEDMEKYSKIIHGIHKRGEMDIPEVTYPTHDGKIGIIQGRHRLMAFEAAGAEKILVLVHKDKAAALEAVAGVGPGKTQDAAKGFHDKPSQHETEDRRWAEEVERRRENFAIQKDAADKAGTSGKWGGIKQ